MRLVSVYFSIISELFNSQKCFNVCVHPQSPFHGFWGFCDADLPRGTICASCALSVFAYIRIQASRAVEEAVTMFREGLVLTLPRPYETCPQRHVGNFEVLVSTHIGDFADGFALCKRYVPVRWRVFLLLKNGFRASGRCFETDIQPICLL